jgi:cytochrome c oxidase subunit 2
MGVEVMLFELPLFPEEASTGAVRVDQFFFFMVAICAVIVVLVVCFILYFIVKYRRRTEEQKSLPSGTPRWLEIGWTVIPLFIFMFIFVWGANLYFSMERPPADTTDVYVVGKQWMWKFQHPEGQREINQLHVPVGRPLRLIMASEDVIHSFFVPAFRVHKDVVPGRYTTVWFEATKVGEYHLFCSQYCGTDHSGMIGSVVVMEPADYRQWLSEGGEGSLASEGQKLFRQLACNTCHTGDSQARAPFLGGLFGKPVQLNDGQVVQADENYLRESILNPQAKTVAGFQSIMPTFQNQVSEEQVSYLIAYIKSLRAERQQIPPVSSPTGPQPAPVDDALKKSTTPEKK